MENTTKNRKKGSKETNHGVEELCGSADSKTSVETGQISNAAGGRCYGAVSFTSILKCLVIILIIPPLINYASLKQESRAFLPEGGLWTAPKFDHKLFVNCKGRGEPVIIMDSPEGRSSDVWALIQPHVAKFTKVCVYDRAGLGFSERHFYKWNSSGDDVMRNQWQPTTEHMVDDLHFLVDTVANNSAVILVGGGLGALNVRFYTQIFEKVFGVVMINMYAENIFSHQNWEKFWFEKILSGLQLQQIFAATGLTRLALLTGLYKPRLLADDRLDASFKICHKHMLCNPSHIMSSVNEHYFANESLAQIKVLQKIKPFPKMIPVRIISSDIFDEQLSESVNQFWHENQKSLEESNTFAQSEYISVKSDFNHVYLNDATLIINTIQKLVKTFRKTVKHSVNI